MGILPLPLSQFFNLEVERVIFPATSFIGETTAIRKASGGTISSMPIIISSDIGAVSLMGRVGGQVRFFYQYYHTIY